jgi:hypothetical protein
MDWAKQSEEMLKNWSETQQAMWKNWTDMFPGAGAAPQATELWTKTVETWEQALHSSMDAQAEWMRMWVESLESQDQLPDEMVQWAEQVQEMSRQWGASQAQLWDGWFAMLKNMQPANVTESWLEDGQKAFQAWQDSAKKVMDANMKLAENWAAFGTTANGK